MLLLVVITGLLLHKAVCGTSYCPVNISLTRALVLPRFFVLLLTMFYSPKLYYFVFFGIDLDIVRRRTQL